MTTTNSVLDWADDDGFMDFSQPLDLSTVSTIETSLPTPLRKEKRVKKKKVSVLQKQVNKAKRKQVEDQSLVQTKRQLFYMRVKENTKLNPLLKYVPLRWRAAQDDGRPTQWFKRFHPGKDSNSMMLVSLPGCHANDWDERIKDMRVHGDIRKLPRRIQKKIRSGVDLPKNGRAGGDGWVSNEVTDAKVITTII